MGVEGIPADILRQALIKSGVDISDNVGSREEKIVWADKIMLYDDGFIGKDNSEEKRKKLLKLLKLPSLLSSNSLIEVLNTMYTPEEYKKAAFTINTEENTIPKG